MFQLKSVVPLATAGLRLVKATGRKLAVGALALLAVAGLTVSGASVASADPIGSPMPRDINLYGSDTTQDVMNGVAANSNTGTPAALYLGSWNAGTTNSASPIPVTATAPAPNGSGEGVAALKAALNNVQWKDKTVVGKIQAARSSSAPKAADLDENGALQYVPFARDAVTYATASNSIVPSGIPLTADAGKLSLKAIFKCDAGSFEFNNKWYHTVSSNQTGSIKLQPLRLQPGSGTRSFWEGVVGDGTCLTGSAQEHNGKDIQASRNALAPFSVSQWLAQSNVTAKKTASGALFPDQQAVLAQRGIEGDLAGIRVTDRRYGVKLNSVGNDVDTSSPTSGPTNAKVQNESFLELLTRDVYTVIPTDAVLNPNASTTNKLLNEAFVSATSDALTAQVGGVSVITKFGFTTKLKGEYPAGSTPVQLRVKL